MYGDDRLFVYFQLAQEPDERLERSVTRLREAKQPVLTIGLEDRLDLGQEFFRWEVAVSTAGSILGINPFDQPNVQESKDNTRELLKIAIEKGSLPEGKPSIVEGPLSLYGDYGDTDIRTSFSRFFSQVSAGDYVSILAYLTEEAATENALRGLCQDLQQKWHVATTVGYGPRYLHSTGQYHKGGANQGLFILLTAEDGHGPALPANGYDFSTLRQAQALGDFQALQKHGRRILRLHLGDDINRGILRFRENLQASLNLG